MPIDAIGNTLNQRAAGVSPNSSISQDDFIKLFLTQLQFQDPLEPVDNRQFLAQLAQFSSLEQSRQTSQNTNDLLSMNATTQAVALLGRHVEVLGVSQDSSAVVTGTVTAVAFTASGAQLTVQDPSGQVSTGIRLSQVSLVKP